MSGPYVVETSDGLVHDFADREEAIDCLNHYGPEVLSHNLGDGFPSADEVSPGVDEPGIGKLRCSGPHTPGKSCVCGFPELT